jgi:mechanosensitive ion channel-like protein
LLPLLQTALLGVIIVVTSLMVLSHLGIDIAPLLAGAGVVGLAIGFGSQALVKDIITGLFILLEDQIAVGDIVDVGKDHRGVVEAISIRTIRMRDVSGTVHTVPFSEVTSVKNLTKEYSYAVARIGISYREDIDRVVEILRQVGDELMQDDALRPSILDPFEYLGVDALDTSSVVLLVRIRTTPGKQLVVGRAFNRLVKIAFDEHRVASGDPTPIIVVNASAALGDSSGLGVCKLSVPQMRSAGSRGRSAGLPPARGRVRGSSPAVSRGILLKGEASEASDATSRKPVLGPANVGRFGDGLTTGGVLAQLLEERF